MSSSLHDATSSASVAGSEIVSRERIRVLRPSFEGSALCPPKATTPCRFVSAGDVACSRRRSALAPAELLDVPVSNNLPTHHSSRLRSNLVSIPGEFPTDCLRSSGRRCLSRVPAGSELLDTPVSNYSLARDWAGREKHCNAPAGIQSFALPSDRVAVRNKQNSVANPPRSAMMTSVSREPSSRPRLWPAPADGPRHAPRPALRSGPAAPRASSAAACGCGHGR